MDEVLDPDLNHETLIHDLNNVFETITEAAELLSDDANWKPLAATLCRSVARGKRLLGAIPDRKPTLSGVIYDAMQSVTDYCTASRKAKMNYVCDYPAEVIYLPGAAKDWERVFINLFLNTAQALKRPGKVEIAGNLTDDQLVITIADNGPGIPEELLGRIFRPNVSTKTDTVVRTGLGLHIVATIVKKHGGRVVASNRETGSGAVFTISLPLH